MRIAERDIFLKDGTKCRLRSPEEEDAGAALAFLDDVSRSPFLLAEPWERRDTVENERKFIRAFLLDEGGAMIGAFAEDGALAGLASVRRVRDSAKLRHRAELGVSVAEGMRRRGLGFLLMRAAEDWAKKAGFEQLELSVFAANFAARALYGKCGFEIWGARKRAFRLSSGGYDDEILMAKFLTRSGK